jgi:DNA-binding NarL/FixJ family response regulator
MTQKITGQEGVTKVAVVDDHTVMREGLAQLVRSKPGYDCCWTAGDVSEAMDCLEEKRPDLLLADMTMPGRNGLELLKDALSIAPGLPILVVSMHDETLYAQRVLRAGGKGYIMKDAPAKTLLEAIEVVADGGTWVSPEMSSKIIRAFSGKPSVDSVNGVDRLTDREFELFQLLGEGRSKAEISDSLNISPKTVDVHKSHIREKLELKDAVAVLRYAIQWVEMEIGAPGR